MGQPAFLFHMDIHGSQVSVSDLLQAILQEPRELFVAIGNTNKVRHVCL